MPKTTVSQITGVSAVTANTEPATNAQPSRPQLSETMVGMVLLEVSITEISCIHAS